PIYDDVVQHLQTLFGTETEKEVNQWYTAHYDTYFNDPAGVKDPIHEYAIYVYALADKKDDIEVQKVFACYLGINVFISWYSLDWDQACIRRCSLCLIGVNQEYHSYPISMHKLDVLQ
ncbi:hypothetical protein AX16_006741, partial [Volvariella volvacea WC 439]